MAWPYVYANDIIIESFLCDSSFKPLLMIEILQITQDIIFSFKGFLTVQGSCQQEFNGQLSAVHSKGAGVYTDDILYV